MIRSKRQRLYFGEHVISVYMIFFFFFYVAMATNGQLKETYIIYIDLKQTNALTFKPIY